MNVLRYVLATASVIGAVFMLYLAKDAARSETVGALILLGIGALLALNFIYLVAQAPKPFGPFRLIGLWYNAKEKELERRATEGR